MRIPDISLLPRLALAALSGLLTYPASLLGDALDRFGPAPVLEWWIILHGILFGALVMTPYISSDKRIALRATAMIIASVLAYYAAIKLPELLVIPFDEDAIAFIESGVIGAGLVALATRFIAPLSTLARYWGLTLLAGVIGGAIFSQTFDDCVLDSCDSLIKILWYSFGWIAWQMLVCAAIWVGIRHDSE